MNFGDYNRPDNELFYGPGSYSYTQPQPPKKKRVWPKVLALILVCALVGGGAGVGGALLARSLTGGPAAVPAGGSTTIYEGSGSPTVVNVSRTQEGKLLTAAEVYASNVGSTVGITTQVTTNVYGQTVASAASGSGFILTADGYIVTNYHVIEEATSVTVSLYNGDQYPAKVVGAEEDNDVAVLKIDAAGLTPVRLGVSSNLVVGEDVVAIGNPLGELTFTMTRGIVSALDRTITMSDGTAINVLQTDCAINSGNSGGPLFNMYGQVIGITNAKYSRPSSSTQAAIEGICFAIPIDDVKSMVVDIMEHGYVTGKPYLGVTLSTANAKEAARYGRSGGAYVQAVVAGAAADKAGLRQGDIITQLDGEEVDGMPKFLELRDKYKAGDTVTLTVDREGKFITLTLTFDEKKPTDPLGKVDDSGKDSGGSYTPGGGSGGYGYDYDYGFNFPWNFFGW